jgi:hypothetical protein
MPARWVGGVLALLGAGAAVVFSFPFLGWFLSNPTLYPLFIVLTLFVAVLGALPGVLVGVLIDGSRRRR